MSAHSNTESPKQKAVDEYANQQSDFKVSGLTKFLLPVIAVLLLILLAYLFKQDLKKYPAATQSSTTNSSASTTSSTTASDTTATTAPATTSATTTATANTDSATTSSTNPEN